MPSLTSFDLVRQLRVSMSLTTSMRQSWATGFSGCGKSSSGNRAYAIATRGVNSSSRFAVGLDSRLCATS
eukprot:9317961-Prorocentrum_lima.AAC.1